MKFSQPATARTVNRLRVLNLLDAYPSLSRSDIARMLALNKPSTSEIVEQLLGEQLVEEQGKTVQRNGRRPTMVALKHDARLVLGVDLGTRTASFSLSDLKGNLLRFERLPTPRQPDAKEFGQLVIKTCMKLTRISSIPIAGIIVSCGGTISEDGNTILNHEYWGWKDVPLAKAIEMHTKLPTRLVNHVKAMVQAERWFGNETTKTFFYVNWGEHISSAWVHANTISCERTRFGHLPIAPTGLCRCGGIGCLETIAAGWALSEKHQGLSVKQLQQLNDDAVVKSLSLACQAMAMALIAASAVTGCEKIILGGGIANLDDRYLQLIQDFYREHAHHALAEIPLVRSQLKDRSSVLGSVASALDHWVFHRSILETMQGLDQEKPLLETE
ncbi:MAG: ROK family transcriptional regulator [Sphaerochaeta sp.]|uniref:ROK family transcriptional regulator n=1 Tax=Sphaerochaeta sp. TaxID=1972642 RepID=UPI002FCB709E